MNLVNGITFFIKEPEAGPEVFQAAIWKRLVGPEAIFEEYDRHFNFPYYGFNWDALDECLTDLQWISQPQIVITHHTLPELSENDFRTYLEVLCRAIESWIKFREDEHWPEYIEHWLEVRFKLTYEKQVKSVAGEAGLAKYFVYAKLSLLPGAGRGAARV